MAMTRHEARMVAEELYKLMRQDQPADDTYLTRAQAAEMLKVSVSYLSHHPEVPSRVVNGKRLYSKRALQQFVINN